MARAVASEGTEWWRALLRSIPGEIGCWLRAHLWGVRAGRGTRILTAVVIYYPEKVNLGSNVGIACGAQLNGGGQIDIGNDVFIGPGSIIWSQNHGFRFRDVLIAHQPYERAKVTIGDDVWIGGGAIILPGVHIAEGTVVGAGSVVTMSTSPFSIVAGVPARQIDVRSSSHHRQAVQNRSMSTAFSGGRTQ